MNGPQVRRGLGVLLLVVSTAVGAAQEPSPPSSGPAPAAQIHARRTAANISVDGKLSEAAWSEAPAFTQFVETFPRDGVAADPAFRTEVHVLFDDAFLYVGIRSRDPQPDLISRQLARRDTLPPSDYVEVALSPTRGSGTGYGFVVNAAGVQRDTLLYGNVNSTDSWDVVWDGSAHVDAEGWTAELAIPLRVLRFTQQDVQAWGIHVRRVIPRTHQTLDSTYIPRNANRVKAGGLVVSRFGSLVDLNGLEPKRDIEVTPYVATRLTSRPQFSDPSRPTPHLLDPTADVGLDLTSTLTSSLNLSLAVNPDFGQVEADQIIQNVNTFERFFPEKRPFFTQGLDLFQPVGADYGSPQQPFYSRRVGLDAPILGAAKLTGKATETLEIGVLDAVVMGAGNPSLDGVTSEAAFAAAEESPDRRFGWHPTQPLHLGPNSALPAVRPVPRNYFAGVARQQVGAYGTVGTTLTSAVPLGNRDASGANSAALDWDLRTADGDWGALGQLSASQAVGGPAEGRILRDGVVIAPGDLGYGGHFRVGKLGGEPFRFDVVGVYASPKLDLNQTGFQQFNDYQWYDFSAKYVRPNGVGPFRSLTASLLLDLFNWNAAGTLPRGANANFELDLQLPSYDTVFAVVGLENPQFDTREIPRAGIGFQRVRDVFVATGVNSDPNRPLYGTLQLVGIQFLADGPVPAATGWNVVANATWHPTTYLETYLAVDTARKSTGARYVSTDDAGNAVFSLQRPDYFSMTLRQQVTLTSKLTLQAYAQLFSGAIRYGDFYQAPLGDRDRIALGDLTPIPAGVAPNEHFSAFNLNLVMRWEYRLGSTLYAVYTRSQQELPAPDGVPSPSIMPSRLQQGPVEQTFLIKWAYWWDL